MSKWLVIDAAALGATQFSSFARDMPCLSKLANSGFCGAVTPPFPAVTCTSQATFTTGAAPAAHGIVSNGFFFRDIGRVSFWEQSSSLVGGEKIWQRLRRRDAFAKTAMLFWQNSIASENDVIVTPQPIHKHNGGMFQSCWSRPGGWYDELARRLGPFKLQWYWGPLTNIAGSRWIARATLETLREFSPSLALTYLPHLDYGQQKWGPNDPRVVDDFRALDGVLAELCDQSAALGYEICLFGDYAIRPVVRAANPNIALRDAELLGVRMVNGLEYLDVWNSRAFAVVDHQVAHVYLPRGEDARAAAIDALHELRGLARVLDSREFGPFGIDHPRSGQLILLAEDDCWFAYPWWTDPRRAPDFATHIDIHNKPGYDPLEMCFEWLRLRVSQDTSRVRGSHGLPPQSPADDGLLVLSRPLPNIADRISLADVGDALINDIAQ
ncbi:MAG: alkaline phosphatase family protein [Phycisphaerales bacterium]|nr:alkaline phosphatase family protein [Phycisphaerales bacterium]